MPTVWLPKLSVFGLHPSTVPTPASGTLCGLFGPLSVAVRLATRLPIQVGVNVTVIAQLLHAANEPLQVFVWTKSALFVPVIAMVTGVGALELLLNVTTLLVPDVPISTTGKLSEAGLRAIGAIPVPVNARDG